MHRLHGARVKEKPNILCLLPFCMLLACPSFHHMLLTFQPLRLLLGTNNADFNKDLIVLQLLRVLGVPQDIGMRMCICHRILSSLPFMSGSDILSMNVNVKLIVDVAHNINQWFPQQYQMCSFVRF